MWPQHEVIPTAFSFVQVGVFRSLATFNSQAIDGVCEQNTFSQSMYRTDAHSVSAHQIALIPCTTSVAQGNVDCVPISLAQCLTPCTVHSALRLSLTLSPFSKGWSRPLRRSTRTQKLPVFTDPEPRTRRVAAAKQKVKAAAKKTKKKKQKKKAKVWAAAAQLRRKYSVWATDRKKTLPSLCSKRMWGRCTQVIESMN